MKKIISLLSIALCFFNYSAQTTHTVNAGSYYYTPTNLTVQVGDSVIWINDGGLHDVNGNINSITKPLSLQSISIINSHTKSIETRWSHPSGLAY